MVFNAAGGNMGATGSVVFAFKRMGVFRLAPEGLDLDKLELELIDHGLDEMGEGTGEKGERQIVIRCALHDFGKMQAAIESRGITRLTTLSEYVPQNPMQLPENQATQVLKMIDQLEQDEDVQH